MDKNIQLQMNPLVSIIIPVYNAEKYIGETITSALNQSWQNIELLIIDDGSTDASFTVAKSFENNIVKVYNQKNLGASAARNLGIKQAKGNFIQFLDADDLLEENKIEAQLKAIGFGEDILSFCSVIHFPNGKNHKNFSSTSEQKNCDKSSSCPFEFLLKLYDFKNNQTNMIGLHAWLTPKKIIEKAGFWNEDLSVNDDGEYFCRVVLASEKLVFTDETACYYRKYENHVSLSALKSLKAWKSRFLAADLIGRHLHQYQKSERINPLISAWLKQLLVDIYPTKNELCTTINQKIKALGGTDFVPVLGGKTIETIKNIFGWKAAKHLQRLYYKL